MLIYTIAYNTTITLLRKRLNEEKYIEHLKNRQQLSDANEIISELQFKDLSQHVNSLVEKLTPRQKEIYRLSREKGLSLNEIAVKLNISVNTAKNHLVSAIHYIKSNINNELIVWLLFVYLFL